MKIFIYKFTVILVGFFILFELTIGSQIRKIEKKIYNLSSVDKIQDIKESIRNQLERAQSKDRILSKDDAILLKNFMNKINSELNN
jgi:predicted PurR-regulated permease PerM